MPQHCQCRCFAIYRKDTKGSTAHSVRDRLTALLAKRMRFCRDKMGVAPATIAPTPRESGGRATPTGRFTPVFKKKGRLRREVNWNWQDWNWQHFHISTFVKPCKGGQNTAGGECSVTPGTLGTRQRVPCELGSPRNALRSNWPYAPVAKPSEILSTKSEHRERTSHWCVAPTWHRIHFAEAR